MSWSAEYPRPQLRRDSFFSLDGTWQLNGRDIEVPFPPQAPASGYGETPGERLAYRRRFALPAGFRGAEDRVILHFGAVDQKAEVWVNGRAVCRHQGGYLPFAADITDAVTPGENLLEVTARDTLSRLYPYGKQHRRPHGMWYTPVSGIWQSVWLEAVPARGAVERIRATPDLTGVDLRVEAGGRRARIRVTLPEGGVLTAETDGAGEVRLELPRPRLWTPEDPYLYRFTAETDTDRVESYFALRTVSLEDRAEGTALLLNGRPIFLNGVLDQGYYPQGFFLPRTPRGYEEDIIRMRELGFNCLRKHIKVEPEAFYYACDRLGMLVVQDMVNNGGYSWLWDTALPNLGLQRRFDRLPGGRRRREVFRRHCLDTQQRLYGHPSVIGYTIFNEGWGQFEADRCYDLCRSNDPTRFYDATSGWFAQRRSDAQSVHLYFKNAVLTPSRPGQFLFLSECGGYKRAIAGHMAAVKEYGYGSTDTREALTAQIETLYREMVLPSVDRGLCGVIYTQLSDVEGEINGLYTFDRAVCKVDEAALRALGREAAAGHARRWGSALPDGARLTGARQGAGD